MKKLIITLALMAGALPAFAQVPGNLPAPAWSFLSASAGNAQGATDYLEAGSLGSTVAQATQATALTVAPVAGTAANLSCRNATATDNSTGITYTVYGGSLGSTAEALTCTDNTGTASANKCSDTTDTFQVAAGDLISIKVVNGNSAAANGVTECSFTVSNR